MSSMSKRLFVSIDLPPALHDAIAEVQSEFTAIPGVRTTDPTQSHVTLNFLGAVESDTLKTVETALERAVTAAGIDPFTARIGHFGVFPEYDYISVIWVGVPTGGSAMETLHTHIDSAMVDLGFPEEGHTFTPHVTIARVEHGEGKDEIQAILREHDPMIGTMTVREISLTASTLTRDGPRYETVSTVRL